MNDSLTNIKKKLSELADSFRRNNIRIDRIAEEPGETWVEHERKVQYLLKEELGINDVVTRHAHRVKAYSDEKENNKKLRPRTVVCKVLSFVDNNKTLKKSCCLKWTTHYVSKDFETSLLKTFMGKGKKFKKERQST